MPRRFTIGRDKNCDVPIADDSVSRRHAEIWLAEDGSLRMADQGSSNGTSVLRADQKISLGESVLVPGDQIRFGAIILEVEEIVAAVEAKNPGALTRTPVAPPPIPPPPPPLPPPIPPAALVRCTCGAIKTLGQICPSCHR